MGIKRIVFILLASILLSVLSFYIEYGIHWNGSEGTKFIRGIVFLFTLVLPVFLYYRSGKLLTSPVTFICSSCVVYALLGLLNYMGHVNRYSYKFQINKFVDYSLQYHDVYYLVAFCCFVLVLVINVFKRTSMPATD